jgi:hypothetical protein
LGCSITPPPTTAQCLPEAVSDAVSWAKAAGAKASAETVARPSSEIVRIEVSPLVVVLPPLEGAHILDRPG